MLDLNIKPKAKTSSGKDRTPIPMCDQARRAEEEAIHLKRLSEVVSAQLKSRMDFLKARVNERVFNGDKPASSYTTGKITHSVSDKYARQGIKGDSADECYAPLDEIEGLDPYEHFRVKQVLSIDIDLIPEHKQQQAQVLLANLLADESVPNEAVSQTLKLTHKPGFHEKRWDLPRSVNEQLNHVYKVETTSTIPKAAWANGNLNEAWNIVDAAMNPQPNVHQQHSEIPVSSQT